MPQDKANKISQNNNNQGRFVVEPAFFYETFVEDWQVLGFVG